MKRIGHVLRIGNTAQTMIELAIFGAVLFFVIGGIALNYISGSFQQNVQLQSMRQALLKSYSASKQGSGASTSGSFLVFEDRLTGDFGKYGSIDRQPVAASGSGMMTVQAMQPTAWADADTLPVMHVTVNGESFIFRSSAFAAYVIALKNGTVQIVHVVNAVPASDLIREISLGGSCSVSGEPCNVYEDGSDSCNPQAGYCSQQIYVERLLEEQVIGQGATACLSGAWGGEHVINCNAGNEEQRKRLAREWTSMPGKGNMPPFFTSMMANDPDFKKIKNGRNDVAFNFTRTENGAVFPYSPTLYPSWRWSWDYFLELQPAEAEGQEAKSIQQKLVDGDVPSYSYDIDGDLREETLYAVKDMTALVCGTGVCQSAYMVRVQDSKFADVDPAKGPADFSNPNEKPGIRADFRIYGNTGCVATTDNPDCSDDEATYLDIKEGKLFSDGKPVAVSVLKKNQYDVIERAYQLNINMGDVTGFLTINNQDGRKVLDGCGGSNFKETCFDRSTKTLYIRSLLSDKRGHRWITDTDNRTFNQSLGGD